MSLTQARPRWLCGVALNVRKAEVAVRGAAELLRDRWPRKRAESRVPMTTRAVGGGRGVGPSHGELKANIHEGQSRFPAWSYFYAMH